MAYRTDKFVPGDIVVWSEEHGDMGCLNNPLLGKGPFTIESVIDRPYDEEEDYGGQSNWSAMGHTQHIIIKNKMFSGAFFVKQGD